MEENTVPADDRNDAQCWEEGDQEKRICAACGGSALSPYPHDGGSCPHCFGGYIR
jgi:hypothetical protein